MKVNIYASGSTGNLYVVSDGNTSVMIDPGIPFKRIQEKTGFKITDNNCCLVSHEHGDHVRGVEGVSGFIPIVSTSETLDALKDKHKIYQYIPIEPLKPSTFGTLKITAFPVKHNAVNPVGFHLESLWTLDKLVFMTDSQYSGYRFPDVKYMVTECNYSEPILKANEEQGIVEPFLANRIRANHFALETLLRMLPYCTALEELYLIHNSRGNLDIEDAIKEIKTQFKGKLITQYKGDDK